MKYWFDKLVATALTCLLLLLPGDVFARERRGANIVITLKDGHLVAGELISVKPASLLLLIYARYDRAVDLVDIRSIKIDKESRPGAAALYGFIAGALGGAVAGYYYGKRPDEYPEIYAVIGAVIFSAAGGLLGGVLGGSGATIQLEGKTGADRAMALDRLRRVARIRDHR